MLLQAVSKVDAASVCALLKQAWETVDPDESNKVRYDEASTYFLWHKQHQYP